MLNIKVAQKSRQIIRYLLAHVSNNQKKEKSVSLAYCNLRHHNGQLINIPL